MSSVRSSRPFLSALARRGRGAALAGLVGGALLVTAPAASAAATVVAPSSPPPPASSVAVPADSTTVAVGDGGDYWASDRCHYFRVGDQWRSDQCLRSVPDATGRPTPWAYGLVANTGNGTTGRELVRLDVSDPGWAAYSVGMPDGTFGPWYRVSYLDPHHVQVLATSTSGPVWIDPPVPDPAATAANPDGGPVDVVSLARLTVTP